MCSGEHAYSPTMMLSVIMTEVKSQIVIEACSSTAVLLGCRQRHPSGGRFHALVRFTFCSLDLHN
jgi:hypothetical protein